MLPLIIPIIGLIGSALAIGAVVYLTVKLTISFLKKYPKKLEPGFKKSVNLLKYSRNRV